MADKNQVRIYGTNHHDSLKISDDGRFLSYYNLQNGDGSFLGDYRFCDEEGLLPCDIKEYGVDVYANIGGFNSNYFEEFENLFIYETDYKQRLSEIKEWQDIKARTKDIRLILSKLEIEI